MNNTPVPVTQLKAFEFLKGCKIDHNETSWQLETFAPEWMPRNFIEMECTAEIVLIVFDKKAFFGDKNTQRFMELLLENGFDVRHEFCGGGFAGDLCSENRDKIRIIRTMNSREFDFITKD